MQVQVPIIENQRCKELYQKINADFYEDFIFGDYVICEGFEVGGKASCKGDSGGPLVLPIIRPNGLFPFYQIGIISFGAGCGRPNIPGVNVNVQYFSQWIKDRIY